MSYSTVQTNPGAQAGSPFNSVIAVGDYASGGSASINGFTGDASSFCSASISTGDEVGGRIPFSVSISGIAPSPFGNFTGQIAVQIFDPSLLPSTINVGSGFVFYSSPVSGGGGGGGGGTVIVPTVTNFSPVNATVGVAFNLQLAHLTGDLPQINAYISNKINTGSINITPFEFSIVPINDNSGYLVVQGISSVAGTASFDIEITATPSADPSSITQFIVPGEIIFTTTGGGGGTTDPTLITAVEDFILVYDFWRHMSLVDTRNREKYAQELNAMKAIMREYGSAEIVDDYEAIINRLLNR